MNSLSFSAGDVIFREGESALTMYDIQAGSVGIYTDYKTESEKQIAVLAEGQFLGELGVIEDLPRSAAAVALEDGTVLLEFTEEELVDYLRNRPDQILRLLQQLSNRIREVDKMYFDACRALFESEEANRQGLKKSDGLNQQLESLSREAEKKTSISASLRSSFFQYVLDDLAEYDGKRVPVKASLFERLTVRYLDPEEMHANPDDEFSMPSVGPNDRIINEYVKMIPMLLKLEEDVFSEPVQVQKILPKGYLILNGHHRWAAALKTGLSKIRATIVNPK